MKLLGRIFRKINRNIILLLLLIIEIPLLIQYSMTYQYEYRYKNNYKIQYDVEITKLSPEDERIEEYEAALYGEDQFYLITYTIDNYYSTELFTNTQHFEDQDGDRIYARELSYYSNLTGGNISHNTVIPAGSSGKVSYLLCMTPEQAENTKTVTICPDETNQAEGESISVTVDF
ncbi:MAG: hypothetical protein Q4B70_07740 [Lachnospiraceae bacterium]|nr:hypothetical protein [Lachnospiraceae bacterium]